MTHVKNAESYSRLVDICTGFGGNYNPGHQSLQLTAMRALLEEAQSSLQDVLQKKEAYHRILNERSSAFSGLDILANRVIGVLETLQLSQATIQDARFYYRLLTGRRATPRLPIRLGDADGQQPKKRTTAQLSFVEKAANFSNLVSMIGELGDYVTDVPDLTLEALTEKATTLHRLNREVFEARTTLAAARLTRDRVFYSENSGLYDMAKSSKRYVKVVFGTQSGEAARLKDCRFTKQKVR